MSLRFAALVLAIVLATVGWADVYRVRNSNDSGTDSLRWAIEQANGNPGRDKILFIPSMTGKVILPATPLPSITDSQTVIIGDIDDDGHPDVALNGKNQVEGIGLWIQASRCVVAGLAVTNFAGCGIRLTSANHCTIRSCHLGVNLAGTKAAPNDSEDLALDMSDYNTIGGSVPEHRNLLGCKMVGLAVLRSSHNVVSGNYFGFAADGLTPLHSPGGGHGVAMGMIPGPAIGNVIGGTSPGERNIFGGLNDAVALARAEECLVAGNYIGLGADGHTGASITYEGVRLYGGSHDNTVGGTTPGAGNVIAGGAYNGVMITDADTRDNKVQGNYFGMNAAGTRQRKLETGVHIRSSAGPNIVGGGAPEAGNYFTPKGWTNTVGVWVHGAGEGSRITNNHFGALPGGREPGLGHGVYVESVRAQIRSNTFVAAEKGVLVQGTGAVATVFGNRFRRCATGVHLQYDGTAGLGDLGNSSTSDDGGNTFRTSAPWDIYNDTPHRVKAEGNNFGTTSRSEINARIYDTRDEPTRGKVDFIPLVGGVVPSGEARPLAVTGAAAVPTRSGGVEIVFSLSARADVTVGILNIAGRPLGTIARELPAAAGTQRVVWSGRADNRTPAPDGVYIARIVARDADGQQAQSIVTFRLSR